LRKKGRHEEEMEVWKRKKRDNEIYMRFLEKFENL